MITLDWKDRLEKNSSDFFYRKIPYGDYDFDFIYNGYPKNDNKIPRDVVVLVGNLLATKMVKNHKEYIPFCDYIWEHKGANGRLAFVCIISKFIKKDYEFYYEYSKKFLDKSNEITEINLLFDKIFLPIFKKNPFDNIETIISWMREGNEKVNSGLVKIIMKLGKQSPEFLKKFIERLENRWLRADNDFVKVNGNFLKCLSKLDYESYLNIYRNYQSTREPVFVEILTLGLTNYEDFLYELYENWNKSGNARLKKAASTGLKFLKKRKES